MKPFTFDDISEYLSPDLVPESVLSSSLLKHYKQWSKEGVIYIPNAIPNHLMKEYERVWQKENANRVGGWPICTPYMGHNEIKDLALHKPLTAVMAGIIGEPVGLHLNLTGWVSTERKWHQDSYLNPPNVGEYYIAAWVALEAIHPDSGPFEYVPGSHNWPVIRRDKLFQFCPPELINDHRWPSLTQDAVAKAIEDEMALRRAEVRTYLPKRGDVLLWHSSLVHRGSKPNVPGMPRRAFIAHYSGINHRPDFPSAVQHTNGSYYFPIKEQTGV